MTSSARLRMRALAFFAILACACAFASLALGLQAAHAAPALDVAFDESTGVATWPRYEGAKHYYYYCEEAVNGVSGSIGEEDPSPTFSFDFAGRITEAVVNGSLQATTVYTIKVQAYSDAGTLAEWSYDYHFTPAAQTIDDVSFNMVSATLSWSAPTGAHYYWCDIEGSASSLPADTNSLDLREGISTLIMQGFLTKSADDAYTVTITAYNDKNAAIARSSAKKVICTTTAESVTVEELAVTFNSETGLASWLTHPEATSYWRAVDGSSAPLAANTADFANIIDELYTAGTVGKKDSYDIAIIAYDSTMVCRAIWSATFAYTPKTTSTEPPIPSLPAMPVTFDASTGKASWAAYPGADEYWYGVDDAYRPLAATTADFKACLDSLYTDGVISQNSSYAIAIRAYGGGAAIAEWTTTFSYTPKKTEGSSSTPGLPALPVTFNASTGKASWAAYPGADAYWYGVNGGLLPISAKSANFIDLIDTLYTQGSLSKKSSYTVSVRAISGTEPIAEWTTAFTYTPKKVAIEATWPDTTDAAKLAVTFNTSSGKAKRGSVAGAKVYFVWIDGTSLAMGSSVNFKTAIDGLYLAGYVKSKSSYRIGILAYSKGTEKLLGAWTTTYKYKPAPTLSRATIAKIPEQVYTGKKLKPKLNATIGITTLKKGKHYKVSFKKNKKVGKATVVIKGKGKVKGTVKMTFKIVPSAPALKLQSIGTKTATVKWTQRYKAAQGVQIKYGYNQNMKGAKTKVFKGAKTGTLAIKKLNADKTVFTWARCWTKINGKKCYSPWTTIWYAVL